MSVFERRADDHQQSGIERLHMIIGMSVSIGMLAIGAAVAFQGGRLIGRLDRLVDTTQQTVAHVDAAVKVFDQREAGTFQNVNAILVQAGLAADELRRASTEERAYIAKLTKDTDGLVRSADSTVRRLGDTFSALDGTLAELHITVTGINEKVIPAAGDTFTNLNGAISDLRIGVKPVLVETNQVLLDTHNILTNPSIPLTLSSFAGVSKHLDGTAANFEETLGYIRDDFKPNRPNFWHNLTSQIVPSLFRFLIPQTVIVK